VFQRRTTGSVVCPSCGSLVGVRDDRCYTCGRSNPGLWGFGPALRQIGVNFGFAQVVVGTCVTLWVITLLMSGVNVRTGGVLSAFAPNSEVLRLFGASGADPVFARGRWWTVLSAGWLHGGALHILMNMYWVWQMGPVMAEMLGSSRTVIIYTVGGITGFALSSFVGEFLPDRLPFLAGAYLTVGASASVFGLIGALYHYGRYSSIARQQANFIVVQAVLLGFLFGPNSGIDNCAHLGGFAGGYFMSAFLNPMTRERGDHAIVAIVCLAASALSIIVSIVTGLPLFMR